MGDKYDGEWATNVSLYNTGYIKFSGSNRGEVVSRRTIVHSADGLKRVALFCGALLGVALTWNVSAETEIPPSVSFEETAQITVQVEQPVAASTTSEVVATAGTVVVVEPEDKTIQEANINTASQIDQPVLGHQAMLQVANLQAGYDKQGHIVESSGQGKGEFEESNVGLPYAIMLAMVALIGLVPVARRNGGL